MGSPLLAAVKARRADGLLSILHCHLGSVDPLTPGSLRSTAPPLSLSLPSLAATRTHARTRFGSSFLSSASPHPFLMFASQVFEAFFLALSLSRRGLP